MLRPKRVPPRAWKKGQSGNPAGYSKGRRMAKILKEILVQRITGQHPITGEEIDVSIDEALVLTLLEKGLRGDNDAIKTILDRADGRVKQQIDLGGEVGLSSRFEHIVRKAKEIKKEIDDADQSGV